MTEKEATNGPEDGAKIVVVEMTIEDFEQGQTEDISGLVAYRIATMKSRNPPLYKIEDRGEPFVANGIPEVRVLMPTVDGKIKCLEVDRNYIRLDDVHNRLCLVRLEVYEIIPDLFP